MYCGYETMANVAAKSKIPGDPERTHHSDALIALSYFLPTLAGIASVGQWESGLRTERTP
jgi:hypothetical protein